MHWMQYIVLGLLIAIDLLATAGATAQSTAGPERPSAVAERRAEIDLEIKQLAAERPTVWPPIPMMAVGVASVYGGAVGLLTTSALLPFPSHASGDEPRFTHAQQRVNRISLAFIAGGLVLGGVGALWLRARVRERQRYGLRIRELKLERQRAAYQLSALPLQQGFALRAAIRF